MLHYCPWCPTYRYSIILYICYECRPTHGLSVWHSRRPGSLHRQVISIDTVVCVQLVHFSRVLLKYGRPVAKWPTNPPGDPRSCHRWSDWRPMDSLGFAENVLEWKWRDDSTDSLISNVHSALVKCGHVCYTLTIIDWLHGLSRLLIDGLPRTETDHPTINHRWSVRRARILHFLQYCSIGDWKDISIAHVIIIIKSEVSTFPVAIIFFRGCMSKMIVTSYSVTYCMYIPEKPGICFH